MHVYTCMKYWILYTHAPCSYDGQNSLVFKSDTKDACMYVLHCKEDNMVFSKYL